MTDIYDEQPTINNPEGWEDSWDRARADEAFQDASVYAPGETRDDLDDNFDDEV
jgi:hypothetical protein